MSLRVMQATAVSTDTTPSATSLAPTGTQVASLENVLLATKVPVRTEVKPGSNDDTRFQQHWSVQFWRNYVIPADIRDDNLPATARVQAALRTLQSLAERGRVTESGQSLAYWTYHLSRMGFFASQGLAGVAFSNYVNSRGASQGTASAPKANSRDWFNVTTLLRSGIYGPVGEALCMFHQDYQNIKQGIYKMPWDFTTPGHKQLNPLNILDKAYRFLREASTSLKRRSAGKPDEIWLESQMYPDYYLNTWHYQTDGWLSDNSAKVYEISTETVFVGRQDAMQRQGLVPLRDFMQRKGSSDGDGLQLIEIGTGTGRFATFIKDNYPRLGITQLDLSPFYLQEARKNMDYWRQMRGTGSPSNTAADKDRFLHAPAEKIPVADESHDVAMSVYLFHELPDDSRRAAVAEMWRILRPGGLVVLTDGTQLGDRPRNDKLQGNFQAFNEPNWGTHISTDYGELFTEAGFVPHQKILASSTKVLSFMKPQAAGRSSNGASIAQAV